MLEGDECDEAVMKVVMNLDVTTVVRKEIISKVACDTRVLARGGRWRSNWPIA
jgi:hypothetical protein